MPPVNDNFADAIELTGTSGSFTADNTGATAEPNDPFAAFWSTPDLPDIWYKIVIPDDNTDLHVATSSSGGAVTDTVIAIYSGGPAITDLTLEGYDDDSGPGFFSDLTLTLAAGTYYIILTGYNSSQQGTFDVAWDTSAHVATPDFSYTTDPADGVLNFTAVGSQTVTVTVNEEVSPEDITITASESTVWPSELTYVISGGNGTTPYTFTVTVTAGDDTPSGTYQLTLHGVASDGPTHDLIITVEINGNSGPRPRDALSDIVHITDGVGPNSGLRYFSGGEGVNQTIGATPSRCGILEHLGAPYVWWHEVDSGGNKSLAVARFVDEAWEYLGQPFLTGSGETVAYSNAYGVQQLQDIQGGMLCSDGTDLFAVSMVYVKELGLGDFPGSEYPDYPAWKLASKKWIGGTGWTDWGWDDAKVMNASLITYDQIASGTDINRGFSFDAVVNFGFACAKDGIIYATWDEDGITGEVGENTTYNGFQNVNTFYFLEEHKYFHITKLSGPGKTINTTTPYSGQVATFNNFDSAGAHYMYEESWIIASATANAKGGTPLFVFNVRHFPAGTVDNPVGYSDSTTQAIWDVEALTVVNTTYGSSAIPGGTSTFLPRDLYWDSGTSFYYTIIPNDNTTFQVGYVVTLSADGTIWGLLSRNGSTVPARIIDSTFTTGAPASGQVVGLDDEDVWLFGAVGAWPENMLLYGWIPCPAPGPYDGSAWEVVHVRGAKSDYTTSDVLTISGSPDPPEGPYVAPIPNGEGADWVLDRMAVRIGERVYSIILEPGHAPYLYSTDLQVEYRVYYFEIGRGIDLTSCPVLLVPGNASIFWFYKDGAWHMSMDPANTDDFHVYKDGSWQVNTGQYKGYLSGSWQV